MTIHNRVWTIAGGLFASAVLLAAAAAVAQEQEEEEREAAPQEAAEPKESEAAGTNGLRIRDVTLAEGYEEGQPVGETTTFSRGRIFAVIDVESSSDAPGTIYVSWVPEGKEPKFKGMALEIPAQRRYRTVAMTWATPREPGDYRVVVRTEGGEVLADESFEIAR
ncbi:MAG: DUF2914 domain-containing protein [Myxococcota bacterium]